MRIALADIFGTNWVDHRFKPAPGANPELAEFKTTGVSDFGTVPHLEIDGLQLSQSGAILRHLARTHNLYGANNAEAAKIDELGGAVQDIKDAFFKTLFVTPEAKAVAETNLLTTTLPRWLPALERVLARNNEGKGYFVGSNISWPEYDLYNLYDVLRNTYPEDASIKNAALLNAWFQRIAARPNIAAFLAARAPSAW